MVDPEKSFLQIFIQNLVLVSHTMCAHVRGPPKYWDAGAVPLGMLIP